MSLKDALLSFEGLSTGDAFGNAFGEGHMAPEAKTWIKNRELPPPLWSWTDDTHMAISIIEVLKKYGCVDQDALAKFFGIRFCEDPYRGYSSSIGVLLKNLANGKNWRELAPKQFGGGSYGNGAAMRVAPVGAFYAGQYSIAADEAKKSAVVTHAHPEGQAGAIAVAVAASYIAEKIAKGEEDTEEFFKIVIEYTPESETRRRIEIASKIRPTQFNKAVLNLGNGSNISAQDTVPFCIWCVAHNFGAFENGLWKTVSAAGDCDTTCAIVGSVLVLSSGKVPEGWLFRRELTPIGFNKGDTLNKN